jgi:hypothetical protein
MRQASFLPGIPSQTPLWFSLFSLLWKNLKSQGSRNLLEIPKGKSKQCNRQVAPNYYFNYLHLVWGILICLSTELQGGMWVSVILSQRWIKCFTFQIWFLANFSTACKLRMLFTFWWLKKKSKEYFVTCENCMTLNFSHTLTFIGT